MSQITTLAQLTALYPSAHPLTISKVVNALDPHTITFIEHSPFMLMSTSDEKGFIDISPRGGLPGFIKVLDSKNIAFPDSPGNNRLDSLKNIIERPQIGLIFTIPGIEEVVRIKGTASIHTDPKLLTLCLDGKTEPKLVIKVTIEQTFFHCPKAIMLAKLWSSDSHVKRDFLPSLLQVIKDQKSHFEKE